MFKGTFVLCKIVDCRVLDFGWHGNTFSSHIISKYARTVVLGGCKKWRLLFVSQEPKCLQLMFLSAGEASWSPGSRRGLGTIYNNLYDPGCNEYRSIDDTWNFIQTYIQYIQHWEWTKGTAKIHQRSMDGCQIHKWVGIILRTVLKTEEDEDWWLIDYTIDWPFQIRSTFLPIGDPSECFSCFKRFTLRQPPRQSGSKLPRLKRLKWPRQPLKQPEPRGWWTQLYNLICVTYDKFMLFWFGCSWGFS